MYTFILTELAKPVIRRLGTSISGLLVGMDITEAQALQVETAVISLGLLFCDLILSYKNRVKP